MSWPVLLGVHHLVLLKCPAHCLLALQSRWGHRIDQDSHCDISLILAEVYQDATLGTNIAGLKSGHAYAYTGMCEHMYLFAYTEMHIHIHPHAHVHTHTQSLICLSVCLSLPPSLSLSPLSLSPSPSLSLSLSFFWSSAKQNTT